METTAQSSNNYDYKNKSSKRKKKEDEKEKETEREWDGSASSATVPRTRSQVAPNWTTKEALILVNEVAAVERDCSKALSSYQKWNIIVQNCTAMEVSRPLSQCRNKWNSLLLHYNQIKLWDSDSSSPPYCSLPIQTRKDFGLPLNFNEELFQAMDDYTKVRNHQPVTDLDTDTDTDTERDPEADADLLHVIAKLGSKRLRQRAMAVNTCLEENHKECYPEEAPQTINAELESQERLVEEQHCTGLGIENPPGIYSGGPQGSLVEEQLLRHQMGKMKSIHTEFKPQGNYLEEEPQKLDAEERGRKPLDEKRRNSQMREKKNVSYGEKEQMMMVEKLCVNAELILAIVNRKLPGTSAFEAADFKSVEDLWHHADKVITCLGDIVNIVNQFPFLVQG